MSLSAESDTGASRSSRRNLVGWTLLAFLAVWGLIAAGGRRVLFHDPGVFWHTVLGERFLRSGRVVAVDPFSFAPPSQPWLDTHWLAEAIMAGLHRLGGLDGLLQGTALAVAATLALLHARALRRGLPAATALLLTALALGGIAPHIHPRPHLATLLLQGLVWALVVDVEAARRDARWLAALPAVFAVWANLHGGVLGGIATVGLALVGWLLIRSRARPAPPAVLVGLGVTLALTPLVNPFGIRWFEPWLRVMASPVVPRLIDEHAPLARFPAPLAMTAALAALYLAALIGADRRPRVTWLVPLAWLPLAWLRVRHAPLFAITALVTLVDLWPHVRWRRWLADRGSVLAVVSPPTRSSAWPAVIGPLGLAILVLAGLGAGVRAPVVGRGWAELDRAWWPVGLLPELRRMAPEGAAVPVLNEMLDGGFLIAFVPGARVFVDDRCELYGDARLLELEAADRDPAGAIAAWRRRFAFDLALARRGSPIDRALRADDRWTLMAEDGVGALHQHRAPAPATVNSWRPLPQPVDTPGHDLDRVSTFRDTPTSTAPGSRHAPQKSQEKP